jgi:hypothetical protein
MSSSWLMVKTDPSRPYHGVSGPAGFTRLEFDFGSGAGMVPTWISALATGND